MTRNKYNSYYAWVSNDDGASTDVEYSRGKSKRNAIEQCRKQYGKGWTAHIMCIYGDGDGKSTIGVEEIMTFNIR